MESATIKMTFRSEWDSKSLVTKGIKLWRMADWKALTKYRSQILYTSR